MSINCISPYISGSILLQMYNIIWKLKRQILNIDCGGDKTLIIKTTQTREEINLIGFEKNSVGGIQGMSIVTL